MQGIPSMGALYDCSASEATDRQRPPVGRRPHAARCPWPHALHGHVARCWGLTQAGHLCTTGTVLAQVPVLRTALFENYVPCKPFA